jgi:antitoxin component of MazEF toxin-antitoxin module
VGYLGLVTPKVTPKPSDLEQRETLVRQGFPPFPVVGREVLILLCKQDLNNSTSCSRAQHVVLSEYMVTETKIGRSGKNLIVRLPAGLVRDLKFRHGDRVTLRLIDHGFAIEAQHGSRLAALLASVGEPEVEISGAVPLGSEVFD